MRRFEEAAEVGGQTAASAVLAEKVRSRHPAGSRRRINPRPNIYAATSGRRWARSADGLREPAESVGPGGEDDVAKSGGEAGAGGGVRVAEGAVAHEGLEVAPFAAGGDAGIQSAARLAGAWAVAPSLVEDGPPAEDGRPGTVVFCGSRVFGGTYAFDDQVGKCFGGEVLESAGASEQQRDDLAYYAIRGCEQQLIDVHGGAQSDTKPAVLTENAVRGVRKDHPLGRLFHQLPTLSSSTSSVHTRESDAMKKRAPKQVPGPPLADGSFAYGRELGDPYTAFYNYRTTEPSSDLDMIASKPLLFIQCVRRTGGGDEWQAIGNRPLESEVAKPVVRFRQNVADFRRCRIYDSVGMDREATPEECVGLERAAVWETYHIEQRLLDTFMGRPNQSEEHSRVRLQ